MSLQLRWDWDELQTKIYEELRESKSCKSCVERYVMASLQNTGVQSYLKVYKIQLQYSIYTGNNTIFFYEDTILTQHFEYTIVSYNYNSDSQYTV